MDREWRYPSFQKQLSSCYSLCNSETLRHPCFSLSRDFITRCVISYRSRIFFNSKHYLGCISMTWKAVLCQTKKRKKKYDWEGMTPSYYGGVWQACSLNQDCCIWLTLIVGFCSIRWQVLNGFLYFVMQLNVWIFEMCSNTLKKAFFFLFLPR